MAEHHSRKHHGSSTGVGFLRHRTYSARVISSDLNQTSLCTCLSTMVTCFVIHLQSTAGLRWIHCLAHSNRLPCAHCHPVREVFVPTIGPSGSCSGQSLAARGEHRSLWLSTPKAEIALHLSAWYLQEVLAVCRETVALHRSSRCLHVTLGVPGLLGAGNEKGRTKLGGGALGLAGTSQALPLPKERAGFDPTVFYICSEGKK